jgi:hypothetical protein
MAKVNVVHPDGTETPYLGHLEKVVVNYDVKGVCFIEGCVTPPAYMVIQTTSVNFRTNERRTGARCFACPEHRDEVVRMYTFEPMVQALDG